MRQVKKRFGAGVDIGNTVPDAPFDASTYSQQQLKTMKDALIGGLGNVDAETSATATRWGEAKRTAARVSSTRIERIGRLTAQRFREMLEVDAGPADGDVPGFAPVQITVQAGGGYLVVDTVEKAIDCLTQRWPGRKGEAFEEAVQACIDGINHRIPPQDVRQAFIKAANEAGIHILL
ncbi:MAG: DUF982 domain-containing protein [Rhizobium sp.]